MPQKQMSAGTILYNGQPPASASCIQKKDFVAQLCLWPSKRVSVKIIFKCFKRKACDRLPTVYPKIDNHF